MIEAKGYSKTKLYGFTEEQQLQTYFHGSGARLAVLTNGKDWYFYDGSEKKPFGVSRGPDADIFEGTIKTATALYQALNKCKFWGPG